MKEWGGGGAGMRVQSVRKISHTHFFMIKNDVTVKRIHRFARTVFVFLTYLLVAEVT